MSQNRQTVFILFVFLFSVLGFLLTARSAVSADAMVSAANPHAVRAGIEILRKGGSATDAAIAAQMVLNLVEPQASGIGGGAFMLHWDAGSGELTTFDGRETAPANADENLFAPHGSPMKWESAVAGGRSVGVPGLLAMLKLAHGKHGKLRWEKLFVPAIELAEKGFEVSPRLHSSIAEAKHKGLGKYPAARNYFFTAKGDPLPEGFVLRNPEFAETLRTVARGGTRKFYTGAIAADIVRSVRGAKDNPGLLSLSDLRDYRPVMREPVCASYRKYKVCGMGPPTSGGMTTIQILKMVEPFDMPSLAPISAEAAHIFTQAAKLAYADRNVYMADSDFYPVPVSGLIDPGYLLSRSKLINPLRDMGNAQAGTPDGAVSSAQSRSPEHSSTTHISVADGYGNAVSMTSSIEYVFGSTLMARGFLLNNQLTDFSFASKSSDGRPVANRVQPNKRPRSSMSPTMVFDENGKLRLVIGSPGGSRIINYVARTIIAVLDWGMDVQSAISLPHYVNRNGKTELEAGTSAERLAPVLRKLGHGVRITGLVSGLHGIEFTDKGIRGGADPRREGTVAAYGSLSD